MPWGHELAEVLRVEIDKIGRDVLARAARALLAQERQKIIDRFNRQFTGFARIGTKHGADPEVILTDLVTDFTATSLSDIEKRMLQLLQSTDDHRRIIDLFETTIFQSFISF